MTDQNQNTDQSQNTDQDFYALQAEVERLRAHNSEILIELKQAKKDLKAACGGENATWRDRYYQAAVTDPLNRELQELAAVPYQYLRDICQQYGLLRFVLDESDGVERPAWFDENGNPADLSRGLYYHLGDVYTRMFATGKGEDLGRSLKVKVSGGGARQSSGVFKMKAPEQESGSGQSQPKQFGLR